ncbi:MAG: lipoyl(octanoyl) transferase LipB [Desulfocucumaceae bacterium]
MAEQTCYLDAGFLDYPVSYRILHTLSRRRIAGFINDVLMLVEHSPTLTVGRSGGLQNIKVPREQLERQGIKVYEVDRGGNIPYHGPGQLVGYPVLDLKRHGQDIHRYIRQLEEVIIKSLAIYGIRAGRRENHPGVWVGGDKVAALGVAVKNWVTMHGFAFNISCNLDHFRMIVPCGITDGGVTSLARQLGKEPDFREVSRVVRDMFASVFDMELKKVSLEELVGPEAESPFGEAVVEGVQSSGCRAIGAGVQ